jgi:NADH pyrophosphatase NudC (nudix superfamily)
MKIERVVLMSDVQAKLGEGLNKLKDGIEQGKQKLQQVQETSELKRKVKEYSQKKAKIYLDLGGTVYQMIRNNQISNDHLVNISKAIVDLDKAIYQSVRKINELSESDQKLLKCECGAFTQATDKFCGACGKKNQQQEPVNEQSLVACKVCKIEILRSPGYCPCCGSKDILEV